MNAPAFPLNEAARLETLRALQILDTAPEERFDRITRMAKRMFGVPISLVSLVDSDRQWFKSAQGLDATETPRDISFCGHAILGDELFYIPNALEDERFADNPLVVEEPEIRFYAGSPLLAANGHKLGTLCLIDSRPRELNEEDKILLRDLAVVIEQEIASMLLATMDDLTQISNRRGFHMLAGHALSMCRRNKLDAALILFDLNHFKPINDEYGHAEGDRALRVFANTLKSAFRESDVFARTGGDEFVAFLTGLGKDEVNEVLSRFRSLLAEENQRADRGYNIEFSAGIAYLNEEDTLESAMERADQAMYHVKRSSR
jgi:diguanylate cyclase (GGDEF)-like protein